MDNIAKKWQTPENKKVLKELIKKFGKYKFIQIIGWDGENRYFQVETERIITKGIKAKELLSNKYGKEITEKIYKNKTKKA